MRCAAWLGSCMQACGLTDMVLAPVHRAQSCRGAPAQLSRKPAGAPPARHTSLLAPGAGRAGCCAVDLVTSLPAFWAEPCRPEERPN